MTLGEKIKQARFHANLTQKELAGEQITRNMLSQIENDLAMPSMRTLEYLSQKLEIPVGILLSEQELTLDSERSKKARLAYAQKQYASVLQQLENQGNLSEEEKLLLAKSSLEMAQKALQNEKPEQAELFARKAIEHNDNLYFDQTVAERALEILAKLDRTQFPAYDMQYRKNESQARYHLLKTRDYLRRNKLSSAEKELLSIFDIPDSLQAEFLILRGTIALEKGQTESAYLYLQQAETNAILCKALRRELYHLMELCCKAREDYKSAYEYAAKQLAL